jgi:hypothetical protein
MESYLSYDLRQIVDEIFVPKGAAVRDSFDPTDFLQGQVDLLHLLDAWDIVDLVDLEKPEKKIQLLLGEN